MSSQQRTKGIILAGGMGSRLAPLTKTDNKHLLPVYNKRMIEYPLRTLTEAGVEDIVIVTGGNRPGTFVEYLKDGSEFGARNIAYVYQEGMGGVADALKCARAFVSEEWNFDPGERTVVILGDNYFECSIKPYLNLWSGGNASAGILLRKTDTPWYFGIAEVHEDRVISIEEKPSQPKSDLAILGCYFFRDCIWPVLDDLVPSQRGELEITDALKVFMMRYRLDHFMYEGYWSDMGTFDTWTEVSRRVASLVTK